MTFATMKVKELREVGGYFGVDLEEQKTKNEIISTLAEEGISYEMYAKFLGAETAEVTVEEPKKQKKVSTSDTVLVRMDRENPAYEINGYKFTREHPYVAMDAEDAEFIFESQTGFRMATPREVQEYYS
jgi:uncharacterized protein YpmB